MNVILLLEWVPDSMGSRSEQCSLLKPPGHSPARLLAPLKDELLASDLSHTLRYPSMGYVRAITPGLGCFKWQTNLLIVKAYLL